MKYRMFITPYDKNKDLFGTGFMGVEIASMEDVRNATRRYACNSAGEYKSEYIKYTFMLSSTKDKAEAEGNRQAKEYGMVNLFQVASVLNDDPFKGISIYYRPGRWVDDNGKEFALCIFKGDKAIPFYGTFRNALKEIGIDIEPGN